jgi:hypothetical protein
MEYYAVYTVVDEQVPAQALRNGGKGSIVERQPWTKIKEMLKWRGSGDGNNITMFLARPKSPVGVEWVAYVSEVTIRGESTRIEFTRLGKLEKPIPFDKLTRYDDGKPLGKKASQTYVPCLFDDELIVAVRSAMRSRRSVPAKVVGVTDTDRFQRLAAEEEVRNDPKCKSIDETVRKALVDCRIGQGAYRKGLIKLWGGKCALTGCPIGKVLVASHSKKWANSSNAERLDPYNGLLLTANVDKLFDSGLISFDDKGRVLIGKGVDRAALTGLGLNGTKKLSFVRQEHLPYLQAHRKHFGFKV